MKTKKILVLPYDPQWQQNFEAIRRELSQALGDLALAIEHVGSTSVAGLAAKPIIDIDVVIRDSTPLEAVVAALAKAGYVHEGDLGIPQREAFCYDEKAHLQKHHSLCLSRIFPGTEASQDLPGLSAQPPGSRRGIRRRQTGSCRPLPGGY